MNRRWLTMLLVLLAWPLQATTVKRMDLDGLVATADIIVVGTVESSRTYWDPGGRLILKRNTIRVSESLKGQSSSTVDVTTIGGTLDGITLDVAGMRGFTAGEDSVVFLEGTGLYRTLVGLGQGKFSVEGDVVSNDISNLEFVGERPRETIRMTLDSFRDEIRQRVSPF